MYSATALLSLVTFATGHPLDFYPGLRLYDLYQRASIRLPKRTTVTEMVPLYMGQPEYEDHDVGHDEVVIARPRRSIGTAGHHWVLPDEETYDDMIITRPKRSLGNAMQHYILSRSRVVPIEL